VRSGSGTVQIAALVSRIFDFLSANYGHAWAKGIEHSTKEQRVNVWSEAVRGLTPEQLQHAKKKILRGECYLEFPPTAAQFRVLCQSMPEKLNTPNKGYTSRFDPDYDIQWFSGLDAEHKLKVYAGSLRAYPALEHLMKNSGQSILDASFEKGIWIKPMIESFRECYKIDSLKGVKIENLVGKA
jgi:hypothetical protein